LPVNSPRSPPLFPKDSVFPPASPGPFASFHITLPHLALLTICFFFGFFLASHIDRFQAFLLPRTFSAHPTTLSSAPSGNGQTAGPIFPYFNFSPCPFRPSKYSAGTLFAQKAVVLDLCPKFPPKGSSGRLSCPVSLQFTPPNRPLSPLLTVFDFFRLLTQEETIPRHPQWTQTGGPASPPAYDFLKTSLTLGPNHNGGSFHRISSVSYPPPISRPSCTLHPMRPSQHLISLSGSPSLLSQFSLRYSQLH